MSDKIQINDEVPEYKANIVPCKIHYSGPADTNSYFSPTKDVEHGNPIAYFRGCKFIGKPVDISSYTGYIINKSESLAPMEDSESDNYRILNTHTTIGKFSNLIAYGHDRSPTLTDPYILMKEWQDLSRAIHCD